MNYLKVPKFDLILKPQVDVVLPLDPEEAYPENEEAQELWEDYVEAQCPRLSAGN